MTQFIPKSCCILKAESLDILRKLLQSRNSVWFISTNFTLYNLVNIFTYNTILWQEENNHPRKIFMIYKGFIVPLFQKWLWRAIIFFQIQSLSLSLGKAILHAFNISLFLYILNEKPTNSLYRKKCGIFCRLGWLGFFNRHLC